MSTTLHTKRRCFAWLLLAAFCLQRILGIVGSHWVQVVEIEVDMDQREQQIADRIRTENQFDVQVKIQDEQQLEFLQSQGYTAPFIFSDELDGEVWYYTIDHTSTELIKYEHSLSEQQEPLPGPGDQRVTPDDLFSKFFFWDQDLFLHPLPIMAIPGQTIPHFPGDSFMAVSYPPPELV